MVNESSGERRQITAVFYDIVNSTALLSDWDPEDYEYIQRQIHATAASIIKNFDGYVDRILGDGGCAFFGYPTPAEDAAAAAVGASLEIVHRCQSLQVRELGRPLSVRVGVATGTVVVRKANSDQLPGGANIVGLAPNLAARLQALAEPDTVAVAASTYLLTQAAFDYRPLGSHDLKGFKEPQHVWRPIQKRTGSQWFNTSRRVEIPLIDREAELDLCLLRLQDALRGRVQVAIIQGEPGIGKSRLLSELIRNARQMGFSAKLLQCHHRSAGTPFQAVVDFLRRDIREVLPVVNTSDIAAVSEYIRLVAPGAAVETPKLLWNLIRVDPPNPEENAGQVTGEDFRRALIEAVLDLFRCWSRLRPCLIAIEDVQWADTFTKSLLQTLLDRGDYGQLMVVATSRETSLEENFRSQNSLSLLLPALKINGASKLVSEIWKPELPPADFVTFVQERCDGVPLFIEELTRLLKERLGSHPSKRADWERIIRNEGVATLKDLLSVRMDSLGESGQVAQIASVFGREFHFDLLSKLVSEHYTADTLHTHLRVLSDRSIIYPVADQVRPAFRFCHALFQEAAYDALLKSRRKELHNLVVQLVRGQDNFDIPNEVMSWHCEGAGKPLDAAQYLIRAAELSAAKWAMREAEALLARAETLLEEETANTAEPELILQLLATRGPVASALYGSGSSEASAVYERGVAICRDTTPAIRDKWFSLYWGWWFTSPDFKTLLERSVVLESDFRATPDQEIALQHLHCSWATHFHIGNHTECLRCIEQGLSLYDPARAGASRVRYGGHDSKVCAFGEQALALWLSGQPGAALQSMRRALSWAEEIAHVGSISHALDIAMTLAFFQSNHFETMRLGLRASQFADEHTLAGLKAKSLIYLAWAEGLRNAQSSELRRLEECLSRFIEVGTEEDLPIYQDMHGELLVATGQLADAATVYDRGISHATRTGDVFWLPELIRKRAVVHRALQHDPSSTIADIQHAITLAERQGAVTLLNRARATLHELKKLR